MLKKKYDTYILNLGSTVKSDPKKFWSFVRSKIGQSVNFKNVTADCPNEQAKLFNEYFYSVFESSSSVNETNVLNTVTGILQKPLTRQ